MYLLIYNECPSINEENWEINWRIEKNLEKIYKFMGEMKNYEFLDCFKIGKKINLENLKKYKNKRYKKG